MFIPDQIFSIPDPGFLSQKTVTKVLNIRSGMFIPDLGSCLWIFFHPGSVTLHHVLSNDSHFFAFVDPVPNLYKVGKVSPDTLIEERLREWEER
jgi:hypothetical protein